VLDDPAFESRQERVLCLYLKVQSGSGTRLASCLMGIMGFVTGGKATGPRLTSHLHLVPVIRMSGAIPSSPAICLHDVYCENFSFKSSGTSWSWPILHYYSGIRCDLDWKSVPLKYNAYCCTKLFAVSHLVWLRLCDWIICWMSEWLGHRLSPRLASACGYDTDCS